MNLINQQDPVYIFTYFWHDKSDKLILAKAAWGRAHSMVDISQTEYRMKDFNF